MHSKGTISTRRHQANEKAPHCWNSGRAGNEDATSNLRGILTTPDKSVQLPPLAADLEGLAVSLGVLAGNVSSEQWEFLKVFRANLCAAAERADAMENALEVPVPGPRLLYLAAPYSDPNPIIRLSRYHEGKHCGRKTYGRRLWRDQSFEYGGDYYRSLPQQTRHGLDNMEKHLPEHACLLLCCLCPAPAGLGKVYRRPSGT